MDIVAFGRVLQQDFDVEFTTENCVELQNLAAVITFLDARTAWPCAPGPCSHNAVLTRLFPADAPETVLSPLTWGFVRMGRRQPFCDSHARLSAKKKM